MHRTRITIVTFSLALAVALVAANLVTAAPPGLPSSFYGQITATEYACTPETAVNVYRDQNADGVLDAGEPLVASTLAIYNADLGSWVYSLDVPASPCVEGDALIFELSTQPVAQDDAYTLDEDTTATIDVLGNDTDGVAQAATATWQGGTNTALDLTSVTFRGLTLAIIDAPSSGTASVVGTAIEYTPEPDYCGPDAFTYSITDAAGRTAQASVALTISCVNDPPTAIHLSNDEVDEGQAIGTLVGHLSAEDPDDGQTHTFELIGDVADNAAFTIEGTALKTAVILDYRTQSTYTIRVRATDSEGAWLEQDLTIYVIEVNRPPTDISLSNDTVPENEAIGTLVGVFTTTDPDDDTDFTYSLVAGEGDADNEAFSISDDQLLTNAVFDYETKNEYTIRVRTDDGHGGTFEKVFAIWVTDVNEPPVFLDGILDQTITQDEAFAAIDLNTLVDDPDDDDLAWSASGQVELNVDIVGGVATISAPSGWDGSETITFTAQDPGGLAASSAAAFRVLARHSIPLQPGWNLVSFNIEPPSTDITYILTSVSDRFESVYAWDPTASPYQRWQAYYKQVMGSTLSSLDRHQGFWINITGTEPAVLTIDGASEGTTYTDMYAAANGWNLVGYPTGVEATLPDALANGSPDAPFSLVYAHHMEDTDDPWKLYEVGAPAWSNDLPTMTPGRGYWVKTDSDWIWDVTFERP